MSLGAAFAEAAKAVRDADVFRDTEAEALARALRFLEINSPEDLVLTRR